METNTVRDYAFAVAYFIMRVHAVPNIVGEISDKMVQTNLEANKADLMEKVKKVVFEDPMGLKMFISKAFECWHEYCGRVIGKALTDAMPNEQIDLQSGGYFGGGN